MHPIRFSLGGSLQSSLFLDLRRLLLRGGRGGEGAGREGKGREGTGGEGIAPLSEILNTPLYSTFLGFLGFHLLIIVAGHWP